MTSNPPQFYKIRSDLPDCPVSSVYLHLTQSISASAQAITTTRSTVSSSTTTTTVATTTTTAFAPLTYSTRPTNVTVAVGEPAVFRCGVPETSPGLRFTLYGSHANYSLTCPNGKVEDIPQVRS